MLRPQVVQGARKFGDFRTEAVEPWRKMGGSDPLQVQPARASQGIERGAEGAQQQVSQDNPASPNATPNIRHRRAARSSQSSWKYVRKRTDGNFKVLPAQVSATQMKKAVEFQHGERATDITKPSVKQLLTAKRFGMASCIRGRGGHGNRRSGRSTGRKTGPSGDAGFARRDRACRGAQAVA
jgi:hypothetical protein